MSEEKKYRSTGRVVVRQIGEDRLLVPISGGTAGENAVFPLNKTGLFIWERFGEGKTVQQAAEDVVDCFDVDEQTALADCSGLLEQLLEQKLVEEKG